MLARNAMVVGKLLTVIVLGSFQPAQAQNRSYDSVISLYNIFNKMFDRASDLDKEKMQGAVYTALNNLEN